MMGKWEDQLLKYRISSDIWELEQSRGFRYFQRTVYDYTGNIQSYWTRTYSRIGLELTVVLDWKLTVVLDWKLTAIRLQTYGRIGLYTGSPRHYR
jgi:hypothetical protein